MRFWKACLFLLMMGAFYVNTVKALDLESNILSIKRDFLPFDENTVSYQAESIAEVPPPGAVQQIRERMSKFHPRLSLVSPSADTVINDESFDLVLDIEDWPIGSNSIFGIGPHVVIQIDGDKTILVDQSNETKLRIPINGLSPGSHRFAAYAAYPWGEGVKQPEAMIQWRFHCLKKLEGTQPNINEPWLMIISPLDKVTKDPILLDWFVWNAPIQNINNGDLSWKIRVSTEDDSFTIDRVGAIWLDGLNPSSNYLQLELLDEFGEPIHPEFNNRLQGLTYLENKPILTDSKLDEADIVKML